VGIINAVDRDGTRHQLAGRERASLMEILKRGGLSLEALCSGSCICSTCHIYVEEDWLDRVGPASEAELATLEAEAPENIRENSRLACQIQWREELDGITVTVGPQI